MNDLAIAIRSFIRPDYLKRTIQSLEKDKHREQADIYLYQDGVVNPISGKRYAPDVVVDECVAIFDKADLPNKSAKIQFHNMGAGLQRIALFNDLFGQGYKYVVCLDGDNVVSEYYISTLLGLFGQFEGDHDIGMIQTSIRDYRDMPLQDLKKCEEMRDQVQYGFSRRWEQGLFERSWKKIQHRLVPLIEEMRTCDFKRLLDHDRALEDKRTRLKKLFGTYHVDQAIENSLILEGMQGICTRVPRHVGIGKEGFYTFNPGNWEAAGLDKVVLHNIHPPRDFKISNNPLCIAVRTLKRPQTLWQCLDSLSRNKGYAGVDFLFYIDGPVNPDSGKRYAEDDDALRCLEVIQDAKLPNKMIQIMPNNMGTAWQKYDILSSLFPRYDYVMMLDNDLAVDTTYIPTIQKMFEQFKGDPKAGILHTSPTRKITECQNQATASKLHDKAQYGFGLRWEHGFWRNTWEKISDYYTRYMGMVCAVDYKQLIDGELPGVREAVLELFPEPNADLALEFAAFREGYLGIHTETFRHKSIGRDGMYSFTDEAAFEAHGHHLIRNWDLMVPEQFTFRAPMIYAEDRRELLKGKEIWVVGSGPSLDSYPDSFLDDKVGMTLHLAYLKFPNATYRGVCESPILEWLLNNRPDFFNKQNILTNPLHPATPVQHYLSHDLQGGHGNQPLPILVRYIGNESYLYGTDFKELIEKAIRGEPVIAGAYSTVLHSMLFALVTMGAKKIHLIGVDHARESDTRLPKVYFSQAQEVEQLNLRVRYRGISWYRKEMCDRQLFGTNAFIEVGKRHGVEIIRHKDYHEIQ